MICSNCSNEITNNAKFCPMCGQKCEPAPLSCANCGLELKAGSKFCPICGTPVGAKETKPESMGFAGNVDAPKSASESLVAAMPAVPAENAVIPEIPAGIPTPVNSAPSVGSFAVPTPVNDVSNTAAPAGSEPYVNATSAAAPAPTVNLAKPAPADFGDLGFSSATAAAVTPIKKNKGGKVAVVIGSVVVAVAAILAVVFLLNKGPIMNMIMGNSRYASMIEGRGLSTVSEFANNPALSQGIRSASASYAASATLMNANDGYSASTVMTHDADTASQFASILEQYESAMLEAYGVNSLSVKLDTDITLTDTAKALLFSGYVTDEEKAEFEKAIAAINSTTITYDITAEKDAAMFGFEMTESGLTVNAQAFMLSDGTVYLCFPFGSDKVIKYVMNEGGVISVEESPRLELDEKEISRLVEEIIDIYLRYYENSEIDITSDGDLFASDAKAHGTLITATMNSELIEDMFAEIGRHIAEDTYFSDKIIEYANECGMELTLDEYKEGIIDAFDIYAEYSLVVRSVVDKNNNVLGKSYTLDYERTEDSNESVLYTYTDFVSFSYVESDDVFAAEFRTSATNRNIWDDTTYTTTNNVSALVRKASETDGSISLRFRSCIDDNEQIYAANIEYSGVKTEKFLGNDVQTGTYTFTITPPADFTRDISSDEATVLAALSASKFTLSSNVDGEDYLCSIKVDVPQYGSIALNASISGSDGKVTVPSGDVIEISDALAEYLSSYNFLYSYYDFGYYGEELSEADKAAMEELSELFAELKDKVASSDSWFAQYIAAAFGEYSQMLSYVPVPNADFEDVLELYDRFSDDFSAMDDIYARPNISNDLKSRCDDLYDKFFDLYYDISYSMTQDDYDSISAQVKKLEDELAALQKEAEQSVPVPDVTITARDFSEMSFDELVAAYYEIYSDYLTVYFTVYENLDTNATGLDYAAAGASEDAYAALMEIAEDIDNGNLSVPKLRDARNKMKLYEEAANAFMAAVTVSQ